MQKEKKDTKIVKLTSNAGSHREFAIEYTPTRPHVIVSYTIRLYWGHQFFQCCRRKYIILLEMSPINNYSGLESLLAKEILVEVVLVVILEILTGEEVISVVVMEILIEEIGGRGKILVMDEME